MFESCDISPGKYAHLTHTVSQTLFIVILDGIYSIINRWVYLEEKSSEATISFKNGGWVYIGVFLRVGLLARFSMYYA